MITYGLGGHAQLLLSFAAAGLYFVGCACIVTSKPFSKKIA